MVQADAEQQVAPQVVLQADDGQQSVPLPAPAEGESLPAQVGMTIHAINLGNENMGDAVIVECESDLLLMDLGSIGAYDKVAAALDEHGAPKKGEEESDKTLSVYFSHYHSDHTGGIGTSGSVEKLLNTYRVSTVYMPDISIFEGRLNGSAYLERGDRIRALAQEKQNNCNVVSLRQGSSFYVGEARAVVLGPVGVGGYTKPGKEPQPTEDENKDVGAWNNFVNNCSLVTRITYGNVSFLTTGDAKEEAEHALVSAYGTELKSDVFKLAHHGLNGNSQELVACVQPTYSFGMDNSYNTLQGVGSGGLHVLTSYATKQRLSAYGLCYMVGEEEDDFVVQTDGMSKLCYRHASPTIPLADGIVRTVGSYGEDRGGGTYDLNDYYYLDATGTPVSGIYNTSVAGVVGYRLFGQGGKLCTGTWDNSSATPSYVGWIDHPNGKQYIYQDTAIIARGFCDVEGSTRYFDPTNDCCMLTGIQHIGEYTYGFTKNGTLMQGQWYNDADGDKGHWMYFGKDGTRASGWATIDGNKYYFDASTGYRACDMRKIGAYYYQFDDEGKMLSSRWYDDRYFDEGGRRASGFTVIDGNTYYLDPLTGYRAKGMQRIGAFYYYFQEDSGIAYTNTSKTFDGYECAFDENGVWSNPPYIGMPNLVSVTATAPKTAQLTWEEQDVDGYEIFRCGTEDGEYRRMLAVKNPKTTTHTIDTLKSGKTYFFKIRGYKTVLDLKVFSDFSNVLSVSIP